MLCVALCLLYSGCAHIGSAEQKSAIGDRDRAYDHIELFTEALMRIRAGYIDEEKTDYETLMHGALRGMLGSLDPHSQFLDSEIYSEMQETTRGKFGGIGIEVTIRNNVLTVLAPIENTPGFDAGLRAGDQILMIDEVKTAGMNLLDAVKRMRGKEGTEIRVQIYRPYSGVTENMTIIRQKIGFKVVKGTRMLDDQIGYVRITQFSLATADDLEAAMEELVGKGLKGLVVDLRNNPGGLLSAAVSVSEKFLKKDEVIVSTQNRKGKASAYSFNAGTGKHYTDFPVVVLVNGASASASEIVAAALRDNNRAVLLGQRTFGKGSIQSIIPLDTETAIRLTTGRYFRPSGQPIRSDAGILPDIKVDVSPEEWRKVQVKRSYVENPLLEMTDERQQELRSVEDRQLIRAVDLLKAIMVFKSHDLAGSKACNERPGD